MAESKPAASTKAAPKPSPESASGPVNTVDLDPTLLKQALIDFEVANARVIDLTRRLTTIHKELVTTTTQLQNAQLKNRQLRAELKALKASRAYKSAAAASRIVNGARARMAK